MSFMHFYILPGIQVQVRLHTSAPTSSARQVKESSVGRMALSEAMCIPVRVGAEMSGVLGGGVKSKLGISDFRR